MQDETEHRRTFSSGTEGTGSQKAGTPVRLNAVRRTSFLAAAIRAEEAVRADALLLDPFAAVLADEEDRAEVALYREIGAPCSSVVQRGVIGDHILSDAVERGVRQVLGLGAGSCTRAYRLPLPDDLLYVEVDLPGQLETKEARLDGVGARTSCARRSVAVDLTTEWTSALYGTGLRPDRPTVIIAEGLFYYLTTAQTHSVLHAVSELAVTGSRLFFDLPHTDYYSDDRNRRYLEHLAANGKPYLTGVDDPASWIEPEGWRSRGYLQRDLTARRCRWLPKSPDRLNWDHRHIWFVEATR